MIESNGDNFERILDGVLNNLGFEPMCYDVHEDGKKFLTDINYDSNSVTAKLLANVTHKIFTIRSNSYHEGASNNWVRIEVKRPIPITKPSTQYFLLEWSNASLDFLMESSFLNKLLNNDLVYCYLYDQEDAMQQTIATAQNSDDISEGFSIGAIKNNTNPGRIDERDGIILIAAALIYYGPAFSGIYPALQWVKFKYTKMGNGIAHIKLFNLYDKPVRDTQKEYWDFWDGSVLRN